MPARLVPTLLLAGLALAGPVPAAPLVAFVDGREMQVVDLLSATPASARIQLRDRVWEVPTKSLVSVRFSRRPTPSNALFNIYFRNGGRLNGAVTGVGDRFAIRSRDIERLEVELGRVRAVRFGRLLHGLQAKYDEVFRAHLARGRDSVIIQRDTRPFPISARVLAVDSGNLTISVGGTERQLPLHKVYGFVRGPDDGEANRDDPAGTIRVRLHLDGGANVTLPLKAYRAKEWVEAGGALFKTTSVHLIEFKGDHLAHIADFDPITVKEVALFGKAKRWQRNAMVLGGPLRLGGRPYERGVGVHAYSRLEYVLSKRWNYFFVRCGIDDAAGSEGRATFRILGDGKLLKELVCRRRGGASATAILLDVSGVDRLVLETLPGESYASDLCNWADARLFNGKPSHPPGEK